jgi:hypothetical protein
LLLLAGCGGALVVAVGWLVDAFDFGCTIHVARRTSHQNQQKFKNKCVDARSTSFWRSGSDERREERTANPRKLASSQAMSSGSAHPFTNTHTHTSAQRAHNQSPHTYDLVQVHIRDSGIGENSVRKKVKKVDLVVGSFLLCCKERAVTLPLALL